MAKTERITVNLDDESFGYVSRLAELNGQTLAGMVRLMIKDRADGVERGKDMYKLLSEQEVGERKQ